MQTTPQALEMKALPFLPDNVVWAERSGYIISVDTALEAWRSMLRKGGILACCDIVWR